MYRNAEALLLIQRGAHLQSTMSGRVVAPVSLSITGRSRVDENDGTAFASRAEKAGS